MARQLWAVWSWDERNGLWMEVSQGTEKTMQAVLDRQRAAAAKHLPSARFTMTPESQPPREAPEDQEA